MTTDTVSFDLTEEQRILRDEIRRNHLRHDAFDLLDRTPKLAA